MNLAVGPCKRDALLNTLSDGQWHPWWELEVVGGNRYGARLHDLERRGYRIERHAIKNGNAYRLMSLRKSIPSRKHVKAYLEEQDVRSILATGFVPDRARFALRHAYESFVANKEKL